MGELFSPAHVILLLIFLFNPLSIPPFWKIFEKIGYPPALSLIMLVPIANLVVLYMVAFSKRPEIDMSNSKQGSLK
jgi:hypothetical protein